MTRENVVQLIGVIVALGTLIVTILAVAHLF